MNNSLFLHIGTPKTGTTTIQKFCYHNREFLLKNGVDYIKLYEQTDSVGNGGVFAWNADELMEIYRGKVEVEKVISGLKRNNVLVSREVFWQNPDFPDWIKKWREFGVNIKIIVYLRRQDLYVESLWNQCVKQGHGFAYSFEEFVDAIVHNDKIVTAGKTMYTESIKEYNNVLNRISTVVGVHNMIVRPFEKKQFIGGKLENDFLNCLGINGYNSEEIKQVGVENESLVGCSLNYALAVNRGLSSIDFDKYSDSNFRCEIERMSRGILKEQNAKVKKGYFDYEKRRQYLEMFDKENSCISRTYLDRAELFLEDVVDIPLHDFDENKELANILLLSSSILKDTFNSIINVNGEKKSLKDRMINRLLKIKWIQISGRKIRRVIERARNVRE